MELRDITACCLIKNEANFIPHVVSPLLINLAGVIVFDTGSQDGTDDICEILGCRVVRKGNSTREQIGRYRTEMNLLANTPWTMIVDGDELYPNEFFSDLANYDLPDRKILGFTPMISVDWVNGQYVKLNDLFNRLALHPRGTIYRGDYPFESPAAYADPANYFYVPTQNIAYHLHRLVRSPMDERVILRKEKQYKFSMQDKDIPVIGLAALPLNPDFPDPYVTSPS